MLLLFFLFSLCRSQLTLYYSHNTANQRYGTVDGQYSSSVYNGYGGYGSGYNSGYSYYDARNNNEQAIMQYDPVSGRYVVQANAACRGQIVDIVNGQQRFYCDCGANGGVSYQMGGCRSTLKDPSFAELQSKPRREGYRYLWDAASRQYKIGAETDCNGEWVDNVNGQMRFFCDCGMFGGKTYQLGGCQPNVPFPSKRWTPPGKK